MYHHLSERFVVTNLPSKVFIMEITIISLLSFHRNPLSMVTTYLVSRHYDVMTLALPRKQYWDR